MTSGTDKNGPARLSVSGELSIYQANAVAAAVRAAFDDGGLHELELGEVSEFDTAGLQILLAASSKAAVHGEDLVLVNPGAVVCEALALAGLADSFVLSRGPDTEAST